MWDGNGPCPIGSQMCAQTSAVIDAPKATAMHPAVQTNLAKEKLAAGDPMPPTSMNPLRAHPPFMTFANDRNNSNSNDSGKSFFTSNERP